MAENYDDICNWVGHITLGKCIGCSRIPHFENQDKICRLCLLDAMKRKLRKMGLVWEVKWSRVLQLFRARIGAYKECRGKSELAALAGAVRQMIKEEKR